MKKQIPVCMSASTIFSGDWCNSLHRSPEGWLPYTYMMLIHHQKFKIIFTELFTVAVWLRHNNQFVFRPVSLTFKIEQCQKPAKPKLVRHFLKLVFLKKVKRTNWSPEFSNYKMIFYTHRAPALLWKPKRKRISVPLTLVAGEVFLNVEAQRLSDSTE